MPDTSVTPAAPEDRSRPEPHRVEGEPATAVRAASPLGTDAIRLMLTAPSAARTMGLLGIEDPDRSELLAAIPRAVADEEILRAVGEVAELLRAEAGLRVEVPRLSARADADNALQQRVLPGQGLVAILAHLVATDTVRAFHAARGLDTADSWRALSDLGQQMRVHRAVFGELGHHTVDWTARNWVGRLYWPGRLQVEPSWDESASPAPRWVLDVHIPATGPLLPGEVDDSFDGAAALARTCFADLGAGRDPSLPVFGHEFTCTSWLLGADIPGLVGPDSNLGSFARRWTLERTTEASDDAAFFVFRTRPPYDATGFGERTRLERGLKQRLVSGAGWQGAAGRMIR